MGKRDIGCSGIKRLINGVAGEILMELTAKGLEAQRQRGRRELQPRFSLSRYRVDTPRLI